MKAVFMMVPRNVSLWAGWPPHVTGSNLKSVGSVARKEWISREEVFACDDFDQRVKVRQKFESAERLEAYIRAMLGEYVTAHLLDYETTSNPITKVGLVVTLVQ